MAALVLLAASDVRAAGKNKKPRTEDIINIYLDVGYSQWLVGPLYYMANEGERAEFLALTNDEGAEAFVREFWKRRDPEPEIFGNPVLDLFERRREVADRRYRERAVLGRRTDRGAIFILHGEPALIEFDTSTNPREPDLEIWSYPKNAPEGLSGVEPKRHYFFAEKDGRTVLYTPRSSRRSMRRQ